MTQSKSQKTSKTILLTAFNGTYNTNTLILQDLTMSILTAFNHQKHLYYNRFLSFFSSTAIF